MVDVRLWTYFVRRLILLIPVLLGIVTVTFIVLQTLPVQERIDYCYPCTFKNPCDQSDYQAEVQACGLDQPIYVQYASYVANIFTFNWGYVTIGSCISGIICGDDLSNFAPLLEKCDIANNGSCPVWYLVSAWFPYTLQLVVLSVLIIVLLAVPLVSRTLGQRPRSRDRGLRMFFFSGYAIPGYWFAIFAFFLLFVAFQSSTVLSCAGTANIDSVVGSWPPGETQMPGAVCLAPSARALPFANASGVTSPTHLPLLDALLYAASHPGPAGDSGYFWYILAEGFMRVLLSALILAFGLVEIVLRLVRNGTLDVMGVDFVRTARAKGLTERMVANRHVGRVSLTATIAALGLTFSFFFGGIMIVETTFEQYGIGQLFSYALLGYSDPGTLLGSLLILSFLAVFVHLVIDVGHAYLDPRVRTGQHVSAPVEASNGPPLNE